MNFQGIVRKVKNQETNFGSAVCHSVDMFATNSIVLVTDANEHSILDIAEWVIFEYGQYHPVQKNGI